MHLRRVADATVARRAVHPDGRILAIHRLSKGSARRAARLLRGVLGCSPSVRRQWPNTPPKARRASLVTLAACVCSRLPFPKAGQALRMADIPIALPAKCNVLHTYHNILTLLRAGRQFAGVQAFGCIFADSPLEGRVMSEPVSEIYGAIPRRLWMISEA